MKSGHQTQNYFAPYRQRSYCQIYLVVAYTKFTMKCKNVAALKSHNVLAWLGIYLNIFWGNSFYKLGTYKTFILLNTLLHQNHMWNVMTNRLSRSNRWLVQERRNSIANALESRLSCTNPSKYRFVGVHGSHSTPVAVTQGPSEPLVSALICIGTPLSSESWRN